MKNLKTDLPASLVVFLVALPLSLGIALASGAPIKSGLIAAIIGGVVVGIFGGAPMQVSGPAAGLTVMFFGFIQKFGFEATCIITILAGIFQILFGLIGLGEFTLAISPSVIEAMLAGIGILIAISQTYILMGATPKGSAINNLIHLPETFLAKNNEAFLLGAATLLVLWAWNKYLSKKFQTIPGSLVAVLFGTFVATVMGLNIPKVSIGTQLFDSLSLPNFNVSNLFTLIFAALSLTVVASAESLLCAVATDKLHSEKRAKLNKELIGQGIANAVSGLLGGLPITGVIVRSSANVNAGAKSNLSAIFHGVWIFVFAAFLSQFLAYIPLSVLAALLIFTGIKLVKLHEIKKLMAFNESLIYFTTLFGVVFINLLWGIGIGFLLSMVLLVYKMAQFKIYTISDETNDKVIITGNLTFLGIPKLIKSLNQLPKNKSLKIVFDVSHLDHATLNAFRSWKENYEISGGKVLKSSLEQLWQELDLKRKSNNKLNADENLISLLYQKNLESFHELN